MYLAASREIATVTRCKGWNFFFSLDFGKEAEIFVFFCKNLNFKFYLMFFYFFFVNLVKMKIFSVLILQS